MRVLIFDTETTGLPSSRIINSDTLHLWPHVVQISYIIYDTNLNDIVEAYDYIIKTNESVNITEDSVKFHGITNEISQTKGNHLNKVLTELFVNLKNVDILVGHNISFDINVIKVELLRIIYSNNIYMDEKKSYKYNLHLLTHFKNIYCTLRESIHICKIKSLTKTGKIFFKYPKLIELHQHLFQTTPNHLHNSFNDILITLRCYMKLSYDEDLNETCDNFKSYVNSCKLFI
jgi:DNA polymerase III epsilon subunit-like protein